MKTCLGCKYAEWRKTSNGRLHPSGDGRCTYEIPDLVYPNAFYWVTFSGRPRPSGGVIDRKHEWKKDCPMWGPAK